MSGSRDYSLEGPKRKLERAWTHIEDLKILITDFGNSTPDPYEVTGQLNRKRSRYELYIRLLKPIPPDIAIVAADFVHNARASLDQMVWQLAKNLGKRTPRSMGFPICTEEDDFICRGKPMITTLPEEARTLIQAMQPYQGPKGMDPKLTYLHVLNALWNEDKHRSVPLLPWFPRPVMFIIHRGLLSDVGRFQYTSRKPEEIVGFVPIREGADVQLEPRVAVQIGLSKIRGLDLSLVDTLTQIHHLIRDNIFPRFAPFFH